MPASKRNALWEGWWPGPESNQRHADFQSPTDFRNMNCINWLAGARVAMNAPRCTVQDRFTQNSREGPAVWSTLLGAQVQIGGALPTWSLRGRTLMGRSIRLLGDKAVICWFAAIRGRQS